MTVQLIPKNKGCKSIHVSNPTWLQLLTHTAICEILTPENTIEEILHPANARIVLSADRIDSIRCYAAVENWTPPSGWFDGDHVRGKKLFMDFFAQCGGFTTG